MSIRRASSRRPWTGPVASATAAAVAALESRRFALVQVASAAAAGSRFVTLRSTPTGGMKPVSGQQVVAGAGGMGGGPGASSQPGSGLGEEDGSASSSPYDEHGRVAPAAAGYSGTSSEDTAYLRYPLPGDKLSFYFGGPDDHVCRLCNELVPKGRQDFHIFGMGPRGPGTHIGREIVLDSLVYHARRGHDPASVVRRWPYILAQNPAYSPRVPKLWPSDLADLPKRCRRLNDLLGYLKGRGVLSLSISPHSDVTQSSPVEQRLAVKRRVAFERLELIGDNAWGNHMASRMMAVFADKGWHDARMFHSFNTMRDIAETNSNLERLFDLLRLAELLPPHLRELVGEGKLKADVFESLIGELWMHLYGYEPNLQNNTPVEYTETNGGGLENLCLVIRHTLHEIYDLTLLTCLYDFAEHAVPLAWEIAKKTVIGSMRPEFHAGSEVRARRPFFKESFQPRHYLPATPEVYEGPRAMRSMPADADRYGPAAGAEPSWLRCDFKPRWSALPARLVAPSVSSFRDDVARAQNEDGYSRASLDATTAPKGLYDPSSLLCRHLLPSASSRRSQPSSEAPLSLSSAQRLATAAAARTVPAFSKHAPSAAAVAARRAMMAAARSGASRSAAAGNQHGAGGCPFPVLSALPPYAHAPYTAHAPDLCAPDALTQAGEDFEASCDEQWQALWQRTDEVEALFTDDVDPVVVLAQFEASKSMARTTATTTPAADENGASEDADADGDDPDADAASGSRTHALERGFIVGEGRSLLYLTRPLVADSIARRAAAAAAAAAASDAPADAAGSDGASSAASDAGFLDLEKIKARNESSSPGGGGRRRR